MPKPFLILQLRPEDDTSDNEFAAICHYGGLVPQQAHRLRIEQQGIPRDLRLDDYSGIIVGGSPFDISTPEAEKTALQKRIEADFSRLFDRLVPRDFPFLGACSGNGLLGSWLGADITPRYGEPVGCFELELTGEGKNDPLLAGYPDRIPALLGHKEACDRLPEGATLLIRGEACPVQMFRVGRNVYATQFHPEGDAEGFILRIQAYRHHGYFRPEEADALIERIRPARTPEANAILRRFVERYSSD